MRRYHNDRKRGLGRRSYTRFLKLARQLKSVGKRIGTKKENKDNAATTG